MQSLVTLIVGHRGVGKTSFLNLLKERNPEGRYIDLDKEIERRTGRFISDIFAEGEAVFRALEVQTLYQLARDASEPTVIAVGAGYSGSLPQNALVLWLRRATDSHGRLFLDRPRLNKATSPFIEYVERFALRERKFSDWYHEQLLLPEGYAGGLEAFLDPVSGWLLAFDFTLKAEDFRNWKQFWSKRKHWGLRRVELRDDLLNEDQIEEAIADLEPNQILRSYRRHVWPAHEALSWPGATDWALELGRPPHSPTILSLHEREASFADTLNILTDYQSDAAILKLAVEVRSFVELKAGHEWWLKDPKRRAFLPRSISGRWRWYRSLFGPRMPIHFFREGSSAVLDQPALWQTLYQPLLQNKFAAVLGSPIEASRSPMEQHKFFAAQHVPFVAIDIKEEEWDQAWPILLEWGLSYAAVTSPLKSKAFSTATDHSTWTHELKSANTLTVVGNKIYSDNTDVLALQTLGEELGPVGSAWIWGGGGVKAAVKAAWPNAVEVSARQPNCPEGQPDLLIWAVGRSREFRFPPEQVRPKKVLDLNYVSDSPGLEWAIKDNLNYQSGLRMFKLQAEHQRQIWSHYL